MPSAPVMSPPMTGPTEFPQMADGSPVYSKPAPTGPFQAPPPPPTDHTMSSGEDNIQVMPAVMPISYVEDAQVGSVQVTPPVMSPPDPMPPQQMPPVAVTGGMPPQQPPSGGAMPPQSPQVPQSPVSAQLPTKSISVSQGSMPRPQASQLPTPPQQADMSAQMGPSLPPSMFGGGGLVGEGSPGLQLPPMPPQAMRQQQAAVLAQRSQATSTSSSATASVPCFAVAREANLSTVFTSPEFRACPMAKLLLLTPAQGGPEFYTWDSSGLSDAAAFSLSLRAREADNESSARPLVVLQGDGPIRRKPLSALHVAFDASELSGGAAAAFSTEAGPLNFDRVAFNEFATTAINVTADNNAKVTRCSFSTATTMPIADYRAKAGRGPPFIHVHRGALVSDGNTFRKALVRPFICALHGLREEEKADRAVLCACAGKRHCERGQRQPGDAQQDRIRQRRGETTWTHQPPHYTHTPKREQIQIRHGETQLCI